MASSELKRWLSSVLVVGVVWEVVQVMLDGHEQSGEPRAAAQIRGEDHTWDRIVGRWMGRRDGPQQVTILQAPQPCVAVLAHCVNVNW